MFSTLGVCVCLCLCFAYVSWSLSFDHITRSLVHKIFSWNISLCSMKLTNTLCWHTWCVHYYCYLCVLCMHAFLAVSYSVCIYCFWALLLLVYSVFHLLLLLVFRLFLLCSASYVIHCCVSSCLCAEKRVCSNGTWFFSRIYGEKNALKRTNRILWIFSVAVLPFDWNISMHLRFIVLFDIR